MPFRVFREGPYLSLHSGAGSLTYLAREIFAVKVYVLLHKSFYEMVSPFGMTVADLSKLRKICAAVAFADDLFQTFDCANCIISALVARASFRGVY